MISQQILTQLQAKKEQLTTRITAINNDFKKGRSADFAEQTTESENDQVLEAIRSEATAELQQINRAILRIEKEEFGHCVTCGEVIAEARLKALPYTAFCVDCAS